MQIRVLSDIHIDINENYPIPSFEDDIFTVIAGDISGDPVISSYWIEDNIKNGLFVHGNHDLVYNKLEQPLQEQKLIFKNKFPLDANVSYLDNQYKIVNDIVFIGCCLYTDYKYNGSVKSNMQIAEKGLNDFRWGKYKVGDDVVSLKPQHYLEMFKESMEFIKYTLKKFKDKKCVLITHHGVSPFQLSSKYINSSLNASFISNLEKFILKHNNLALVVSGHVHNNSDFKIGNTRVICNPYGYRDLYYGERNLNFNPNLIVEV